MSALVHKLCSVAAWYFYRLFPVEKNKVVVSSFYGKGYSDNPKGIVDALLRRNANIKIVWLVKPGAEDSLPEGVTPVCYDSLRRIKELSTAKVWIDNNRKGARIKRKNQYYLQTWHGLALKRIERDVADKLPAYYERYARRDSAQCDVIISNCTHMTKIYRNSFWFDGEILEYGSPRNDVLFADPTPYRKKVRDAFSLPQDRKLILYGPTFRANHSVDAYRLDCEGLRQACHERFGGDWTVLVRLHPVVEQLAGDLFAYDGNTICNATAFPDITELLAATDLTITDYSSLMFDFALTGRPCFQFAVDIAQYQNDRNFYFSLDKLPFPTATSNAELFQAIRSFDEAAHAARWQEFSESFGLCEDGKASERCADWVLSHLK